jgi:phenylacetate-CoA ligase
MLTFFSKFIFYPLWDFKDKSLKLKTLRLLDKTQWYSEEELKRRQWIKLKNILGYAYKNCEYYRSLFDMKGIRLSDIKDETDFLEIPILTKKLIRDNTDRLISRLYKKENLIMAKTGGSTGKSLRIYFDKQCEEVRNAAAIRSDRWADWDLGIKRAAIWGSPPVAKTIKQKIRSALLNRLIYLDTMNLNEKSMNDFVDMYRKYNPSVIFGHSHSIFIFTKFVRDHKIEDILPRGIISTSMMLMPHEREFIESVFKCKVTDRYGCEEVGLIACECEKHEGMHLNIDHLYVEFIKEDGSPALAGESGAIVVTELVNRGMPLIRYRIEDVGILTDRRCSCGRGLPLMEKVVGRVADFLIREDGSLVAGVSLVEKTLTAIKGIEQLQIVQEEINKISLNIVTDENYDEISHKMLVDELLGVFGNNVVLQINNSDRIPQEKSGKYRFSICNVKSSYTKK